MAKVACFNTTVEIGDFDISGWVEEVTVRYAAGEVMKVELVLHADDFIKINGQPVTEPPPPAPTPLPPLGPDQGKALDKIAQEMIDLKKQTVDWKKQVDGS